MKIMNNTPATDFNAFTSERTPFTLSRLKGNKILLSFYRNGACALSNYRLHTLKRYRKEFLEKEVHIVSVFESMPRDILSYAGRTEIPFYVLADPMALLYGLYCTETSEEKLKNILINGIYSKAIAEAEREGFPFIQQEGSNFFRLPADFLIDENFIIRKAHYTQQVIDFLPTNEIIEWINGEEVKGENNNLSFGQSERKIA